MPWVDALHKLGRPLLALSQVLVYGYLASRGVTITPEPVGAMSGTALLYTAMKGKGQ